VEAYSVSIEAVLRAGEFNRPSDPSKIPYEFRDAVELWARQYGRHAKIGYNIFMRCPVVEITLKPEDPRMRAWRDGKLRVEPTEAVPLHYQPSEGAPYQPMNLDMLGVSGLIEMLEKANTWTGRGEYSSMREAVQVVERRNVEHREQMRNAIRQASVERGRDLDNYMMRAFTTVPANIGEKASG
jgi:hypothetical protein